MILKIYNGEYSLQWDGIYYLALIDYPNIQEWELEKIAKFIAYEKLHKRQTSIECADSCLKKEILDYIENVLKKIDEYSDLSAEEAFLLRYYTPYILDLERRKKYFDDICNNIKFKSEKNIIQKIIALCPRGSYKTILKEVKKEAYINPKENRVIRLCRGWSNADYGYKYCPYKYNMNVMYQED